MAESAPAASLKADTSLTVNDTKKPPSKKKVRIEASKTHAAEMFKMLEAKLPDLVEGASLTPLAPAKKVPRKRKVAQEPEVVEVKKEEETEPIEPAKEPEAPPAAKRGMRRKSVLELIDEAAHQQDPLYRFKIGAGCALLAGLAGYSFAPNIIALRFV